MAVIVRPVTIQQRLLQGVEALAGGRADMQGRGFAGRGGSEIAFVPNDQDMRFWSQVQGVQACFDVFLGIDGGVQQQQHRGGA